MLTLRELAEDWIQGRAALKLQLKRLEEVSTQAELSVDSRKAIATRIKAIIMEYDGLLRAYPNA